MSMYKTLKLVSIIALSLIPVLSARAQDEAYNTFSPYSMFGIGDLSKHGTTYNFGMGGVGIATRDSRMLNILNPAAVTERESKSVMVDFGLFSENKYYKQYDIKSSNNTLNIHNFTISFPVYKKFSMYGGFSPFSDVGYDVTSYETDPGLIVNTGGVTYSAVGYGGLNNVFIGGGIDVVKGLSIGAEIDYIFGNIHKDYTTEFENTDIRDLYTGYSIRLHTFTGKFGVQYEQNLKNDITATLGATYRLKSNLKGSINDVEYAQVSSLIDTTRNEVNHLSGDDGVKLAGELGVGFSIKKGDKWTAEVDYLRSDWSDCGMDVNGFANVGKSTFSAATQQSVRAGFSIVPNRNDVRYYLRTVTYRVGTYWDRAYYKLDGNTIDAFGLTFGATFPVFRWSNGISFGVDLGQRGSNTDSKVRERYVNFTLGLNIFDFWFIKPQYD